MPPDQAVAEHRHTAIRALLASLPAGRDGNGPPIPRNPLLVSPQVQALSNAADAWARAHTEEQT
jgi:hypothetical protein